MSGRRDQHDAHPPSRTEPTLGDLDRLDAPRVPTSDGLPRVAVEARRPHGRVSPPVRAKPRRAWLVPALVLLVIALLGVLCLTQNHLRGMVPRTDFNTLLSQAQQALQDGRLDGQDGSSARELFQSAAALEPDNDRARDGLRQVGQAMLARADTSLQSGSLTQAAQQATLARELLGGGSDVDRLDRAINSARARQVHTVDLVGQAQQAFAAGKLDGPDGAGALYRRVLQADPDNAVAAHGLDQVGYALAVDARAALDAKDNTTADARIEQLVALQPNNGALPALRALRAQTRKQDNSALASELKAGQDALRAGRIAGNGADTALAHFQAVLRLDPDNAQADAGLGNVAQALTVQASAAIDAGDNLQAQKLLDQAAQLAPKSADLAAARARLDAATESGGSGASHAAPGAAAALDQPFAQAVLTPQQSAAVAQLVRRAELATSHGDIMMPPGDSAYDLYRSALAIDGNNEAAAHGLQELPGKVRQQFEQALAAGKLAQAGDMLANLAELAPGDAAQGALGNRLASAWLDQAEQQLGRGDRIDASQSLLRARKLAPGSPRVQDLDARLQGGG
jgi:tetratricopeptide (TPR) repeat protein